MLRYKKLFGILAAAALAMLLGDAAGRRIQSFRREGQIPSFGSNTPRSRRGVIRLRQTARRRGTL